MGKPIVVLIKTVEITSKCKKGELYVPLTYTFLIFLLCACMYLYTPCACLVPVEARRRCQIPSDWGYKQFGAAILVLRIKPRFSVRAAKALDC